MYAIVERRRSNVARIEETAELVTHTFIPLLRQAPGFVSFTVIVGDDGINIATAIWDSKGQADAYQRQEQAWLDTLEEHGHHLESRSGGEVIFQIMPQP